jgi:hypothetical protein
LNLTDSGVNRNKDTDRIFSLVGMTTGSVTE